MESNYSLNTNELLRLTRMSKYEDELYETGKIIIAGVDEAGRGPLAGPVVACAAVLPPRFHIFGINDSKKLSEKKRERLFADITDSALDWGIGIVSQYEIDKINILQASLKAMVLAVESLNISPEYILVDGLNELNLKHANQKTIIRGDNLSVSIAAASILAKVSRDRMMRRFSEKYPIYGFDTNKGYGTRRHIETIKKYGICPLHRISFTKKFLYGGGYEG